MTTIHTDILLAKMIRIIQVFGYHTCFMDIKTAIVIIQAEEGQYIKEINLVSYLMFIERGILHVLNRDRIGIPTTHKLKKLLFHTCIFWQSQPQAIIPPRTNHV